MKSTVVSVNEAEQMLENRDVMLLDMRDYRDYLAHHHPRAEHLSRVQLRTLLKHADRSVPVILYCYHGHACQDMAQLFADFGFISCYSIAGGYEAWFPGEKAPAHPTSAALTSWLQQHGFDPLDLDCRTANNDTALMHLCRAGELALAKEMIELGASVNLVNCDGNNALWMAVQSGVLRLVEALLDTQVNVNQQNDNGATPLMLAMSLDFPALVSRLLDAGADMALATVDGFRAEDMAASRTVLQALGALRFHTRAAA